MRRSERWPIYPAARFPSSSSRGGGTTCPSCPREIVPDGLPGTLEIDGVRYVVTCNATLPASGEPVVYGWRLENQTNGEVYDLDTADPLPTCDCKGFTRWGHCKHARCLPVALASLRKAVA